jgi:hypothetical protein
MSKEKLSMADFRKRKIRLQDDLELLEGSLENRYNKAKKSLLGSFSPVETIKKRPLQAVALSVAAGVILGLSGKKKRNKQKDTGEYSNGNSGSSTGFTSLLFDEVKRIAARRAASYISEMMDQKISNK